MSIDDMINDALNGPRTPEGKTVLEFLTMEPVDVSEKLAYYIGQNIPDSLIYSLHLNRMDAGTMMAGVIWTLNHVKQHGLPTDLDDIIEGRKE